MAKFIVETGRSRKAQKIESVLSDFLKRDKLTNLSVLDIGCGNGEIISYFTKNNNKTYSVDVLDQRSKNAKIDVYKLVNSAELPFESQFFDVIISNHVVEHIPDQSTHMKEIHRCLKQGGVCYYATPNRNFFVEPHHKIPFIHYFGHRFFHGFLKRIKQYEEDIHLLSYGDMVKSFKAHGFSYLEYTAEIIKHQEKYCLEPNIFGSMPMVILKKAQWFIPTNIFVLSKSIKTKCIMM